MTMTSCLYWVKVLWARIPCVRSQQLVRVIMGDVEARDCWKIQNWIVGTYIGTSLLYPDAKVASVLCVSKAVKYKVKSGSRVTDGFLLWHIVPHTVELKDQEFSLVLGQSFAVGNVRYQV